MAQSPGSKVWHYIPRYKPRSLTKLVPLIEWEIFCPIGPQLAFHVGCIIGNAFYVHGGITERYGKEPSNKLYKLDFETLIWNELHIPNSPALSHHACIVIDQRFMLLIGGWDGRARTGDVVAFDTATQEWIYPKVSGFPPDAGLSSHTASLLSDGSILVIGREGTLRMTPGKEYTGNVYLLTGSIHSREFTFQEYSRATDSRSGHTTNFIGKTLYILGGRTDQFLEVHKGYRRFLPKKNTTTERLVSIIKKLVPLTKMPVGRKNHIAFEASSIIFFHGGETFKSQNSDPVGDMYVMTNKPNINFYKVGTSPVCRAGHVCCTSENKILLHGGLGVKDMIHGDTRELKIM